MKWKEVYTGTEADKNKVSFLLAVAFSASTLAFVIKRANPIGKGRK